MTRSSIAERFCYPFNRDDSLIAFSEKFSLGISKGQGKSRGNRGVRVRESPSPPPPLAFRRDRTAVFKPGADSRLTASRGGTRPRFGLWVNKRKKKIFVRRVFVIVSPGARARAPIYPPVTRRIVIALSPLPSLPASPFYSSRRTKRIARPTHDRGGGGGGGERGGDRARGNEASRLQPRRQEQT